MNNLSYLQTFAHTIRQRA